MAAVAEDKAAVEAAEEEEAEAAEEAAAVEEAEAVAAATTGGAAPLLSTHRTWIWSRRWPSKTRAISCPTGSAGGGVWGARERQGLARRQRQIDRGVWQIR